jgi:Mg-chelatase subunit ChlD
LHERCPPSDVFADIALVIDASTTMRERSPSGPLKIDVAIAATRGFLAGLRLSPGADRVSLVTFNAEAMTLSALTDDRDRLEQSLHRVVIREQSRIDLGLLAGARSLSAARPNAMRSLILLSDGMANPAPTSDVLTAASTARKAGITLYVVGLGPNMDRSVLRAIAGDPTRYFPSEDPDLLGAIYAELARRAPCPRDAYWGRR